MAGKPWVAEYGAGGTLLSPQCGLEPLGMVIGNAVFAPVITGWPFNSAEVSAVSVLATKAWDTVLTRMREEASKLEADGIHSIRLSKRVLDKETNLTEFWGRGTAVRGRRRDRIWTTEADPGEIAVLGDAGFAPVCLAVGCCTWHQSTYGWTPTRNQVGQWGNQEVAPATQAFYIARATAMERMQLEASKHGAIGVVGSRIEFTDALGGLEAGFTAGCEAYGTGIALRSSEFRNEEAICTVPLND